MQKFNHFIDGVAVDSTSGNSQAVFNPSLGVQSGEVALASVAEVDAAVASAQATFQTWRHTSPLVRARLMNKFLAILNERKRELATLISEQHGKTILDAEGEVIRGIEAVEFACAAPHLLKGEFSDNVSTAMDMYSMRKPLGVTAAITPFNFPVMVPMWMVAISTVCGNCVVWKPSERDPAAPLRIAEYMIEAGFPKGVMNVVNGDKVAVDRLTEHEDIKAVSFVGSTPIAKYVYDRSHIHNKRCQAMGGAKNHMVIMPDANIENTTNALLGAAYGSAGERCMAISVAVCVGDDTADKVIASLTPKIEGLNINHSMDEKADYGPLVTKQHREKVISYIEMAEKEGATLLMDGRGFELSDAKYSDGYFLGPTLIDNVTADMQSYKEEIFGPTLQIIRVNSLEEAIQLATDHEFGNGTSIFTENGAAARQFSDNVEVGMVGINVPIPVPMAFHSFGGWKNSAFNEHNQHGMEGIRFYTKVKTVTSRWKGGESAEFVIPTLS